MSRASDLARRLGEQAEPVCRFYLPKGRRQGNYWRCGDVLGAAGKSLYVHLEGPRAGRWTDAATSEYGDLLDLIILNRGLSFSAALEEARQFLNLPVAPRRKMTCPTSRRSPDAPRRLFAASKPIHGTIAESYLNNRGILLPEEVSALRFHPRCYYRHDSGRRETWPALIAAVTDNDGAITGAHRTWLDPAGGKAPVENPRRAMGRLLGHGVRFGLARDVIAAGEGIETMLALKTAMPDLPMIAALSAAHLAGLILPPSLHRLYVACDNDDAGKLALSRLRQRFDHAVVDVHPLMPATEDFNADLLALGTAMLRDRLALQLSPDDVRRFLPLNTREPDAPASQRE